jgi:recombination protein RecR
VEFSSKIIEQSVSAFAQLPGVGKKTALRYVLHLIKNSTEDAEQLALLIQSLKSGLKFCNKCYNISESIMCEICANQARDQATICIVQDYRDVMAIEATGLYRGLYHVLGGLISPMDGVGPGNLNIEGLVTRVGAGPVKEVILALNATMEGETTSFYVYRKLAPYNINLSAIARGIAVGDELEYADEVTLGRSITNRMPFSTFFTVK